jgi:hypothetical protein
MPRLVKRHSARARSSVYCTTPHGSAQTKNIAGETQNEGRTSGKRHGPFAAYRSGVGTPSLTPEFNTGAKQAKKKKAFTNLIFCGILKTREGHTEALQ